MKCELCLRNEATEKHHYIPKSVIKKINPSSGFVYKTINLCHRCHQAIHNSFIEHVICLGNFKQGFNMYDSVKYFIMKQYMKKHHMAVYGQWNKFWKGFIDDCFKEIENGESDGNRKT